MPSREDLLICRWWHQTIDFVLSCVYEESVGLHFLVVTEIASLVGREGFQVRRVDAGAIEHGAIGPGSVAIHASEDQALLVVGARAEVLVQCVGV